MAKREPFTQATKTLSTNQTANGVDIDKFMDGLDKLEKYAEDLRKDLPGYCTSMITIVKDLRERIKLITTAIPKDTVEIKFDSKLVQDILSHKKVAITQDEERAHVGDIFYVPNENNKTVPFEIISVTRKTLRDATCVFYQAEGYSFPEEMERDLYRQYPTLGRGSIVVVHGFRECNCFNCSRDCDNYARARICQNWKSAKVGGQQ